MPRSHPPAADLVDAVRELLEREVVDRLEGDLAFQCRVAANALGIVARELRMGAALDAAERSRLAALLGHEGTLDELANELARRIRSGALGPGDPALLEALRASVEDALRINNPRWLAT